MNGTVCCLHQDWYQRIPQH